MGSVNFCSTDMVSIAYVPANLSDEELQDYVEEWFPDWVEDDKDMPNPSRLLMWRERLHDYHLDDGQEATAELTVFGKALRDELENRFPFHSEISNYCDDWSWEFEVRGGYHSGVQLVLERSAMDNLFSPSCGRQAFSDRQAWDDFYELAVDSERFSGVTRQDFETILDKVCRFANYALVRFGLENGYVGAVGSWTGSTYPLADYEQWANSEKEKGVFDEWYQCVMRSYAWYCKRRAV